MIDQTLRSLVRVRADDVCEYCRLPQASSPFIRFHIEHIVARQHGGQSDADNLALACGYCNHHKGPNIASIDPGSGARAAVSSSPRGMDRPFCAG